LCCSGFVAESPLWFQRTTRSVTPSANDIRSPPDTAVHRSVGVFSATACRQVVFDPPIRAPVSRDHVAVSKE